ETPYFSFRSFSPSANTLPVGIPAEGLRLWNPSAKWKCFSRFYFRRSGCSEGYFPAETFREVYPSAGMPTGRVFAEGLKLMKDFSGYSLQGIINDRIPLKKVIYVHRQSMCTSSAK
ncbi:hypothetical protein ABG865_24670, partial [Phocaeicola vulgatus]